jgi:hypothetical protein
MDNNNGDPRSQITDEDRPDVATQNRSTQEMLLQDQAQRTEEHGLEQTRMPAEREGMAAERDQWGDRCAKRTKWSTVGPRPNIYKKVDPVTFCCAATEVDQFLDGLHSNPHSHSHLFPRHEPDHVKSKISLLEAWSYKTRSLDKQRSQTLRNGRPTDLRNPAHEYRTSNYFHKRWPRIMVIGTDDVWR